MKELIEYREKLIERLGEAAEEICSLCKSFDDPHALVEGDWTVHQIAFHLRDIDREVYGRRIRRTLNEDQPLFESFDPDSWMESHYDRNEDMKKILNEFSASVKEVCSALKEMPQTGWSRMSRHESLGNELTLQLWAERGLAHLEEHLRTLKKTK